MSEDRVSQLYAGICADCFSEIQLQNIAGQVVSKCPIHGYGFRIKEVRR